MTFDLTNMPVMVVGIASTGLAVARFLRDRGACVTMSDVMTAEQLGNKINEAVSLGVTLKLGRHDVGDFTSQSLVVISPGVPHTVEAIKKTMEAGIPVIGEIELAAQYISDPIVAVTGTNGKTTTTELVGQMLARSGLEVFVGGNIGNPLIDYVNAGMDKDVVVAEISSFQLDTTSTFKPKVSLLLNVTPDHLDRYRDFGEYTASKGKIFQNQDQHDYAILNKADRATEILAPKIAATLLYFNAGRNSERGAWLDEQGLHCHLPGQEPHTFDLSCLQIKGKHNVENVAAASLAALAVGASPSGITETLCRFTGLRHRLEYVTTVNGTQYYDDSKGTNVDAVARALESFEAPVILIMGGRDKGGDYKILENLIHTRVKVLVVIGEAQNRIVDALGKYARTEKATGLPEAVQTARLAANPGEVVLLSPGCSSFDMFKDYAHRGEIFRRSVRQLQ